MVTRLESGEQSVNASLRGCRAVLAPHPLLAERSSPRLSSTPTVGQTGTRHRIPSSAGHYQRMGTQR